MPILLRGRPRTRAETSGDMRHAPVRVRPYLSRFNASLASADTPVPQAAAAARSLAWLCRLAASSVRLSKFISYSAMGCYRWHHTVSGSCLLPVLLVALCVGSRVFPGSFILPRATQR